MARKVAYSPEAENDLKGLVDFIQERSGPQTALNYVEEIESYCDGFADFAERGTRRDDLWPGLRVTGFRGRVAIAFHVFADAVVIDRILYGGRNLEGVFGLDEE